MFLRPTCREYIEAFTDGEFSPVDMAVRVLDACEGTSDATLGAFIEIQRADIMEQAAESAARYAAGRPIGPLDGIPVPVKDEFDVAGYRTRAGTSFKGKAPSTMDAVLCGRLREQGAILFGKTQMTEIGLGGVGTNPHYVTPKNPHDTTRITGGSSSGSAVAVASGLAPLAVGSDAGGSIRMPAALCGVYGLKPTYGRIPSVGGKLLSWSLDHAGPLGASIDDLSLFLDATAGPDRADETSMFGPDSRSQGALRVPALNKLRFAWCPEFADDAEPGVARAFHEALARMREQGATIDRIDIQWVKEIQKVGYVTFCAEAAAGQRDWLRHHRDRYNLDTRLILAVGERISAIEYLQSQRVRTLIRREFSDVCSRYDAFLHPTVACTARPINRTAATQGQVDTELNSALSRYTFLGTLSGFPGVSIPCGVSDGLPVGMHLMAMPWQDERLLRVAAAADQVMPAMPEPQVYFDLL